MVKTRYDIYMCVNKVLRSKRKHAKLECASSTEKCINRHKSSSFHNGPLILKTTQSLIYLLGPPVSNAARILLHSLLGHAQAFQCSFGIFDWHCHPLWA